MTPQEVIKNFISTLANHDYTTSADFTANALDDAVAAVSDFDTLDDVITRMKADQVSAEKEAVEAVLGSEYAGKTISEVSSSILNASAKTYTGGDMTSAAYLNSSNDKRSSVKNVILERKANIFLEKYCGIKLNNDQWISGSSATYWTGKDNGNYDTGAITGSDANISLTAGDVICSHTLTSADLTNLAKLDGASLNGSTLIFGTGTEKTSESVVPEIGNKYTATTSQAQNITTGTNDWIVIATDLNDTITAGGADSINAGAGNDSIVVGANYASIVTGAGNDTVTISESVSDVTLNDLTSGDVLKISGTFQLGSAEVDDTILTITDKTGTRKIKLANFENAKSATLNGTKIADLLTNAGFNLNMLNSSANVVEENFSTSVLGAADEISPRIDEKNTSTPVKGDTSSTVKDKPNVPENFLPDNNVASDNAVSGNISVNLDTFTELSGNVTSGGSVVGTVSNEYPNVSSFTTNNLTINLLGVSTSSNPSGITNKTLDQLTTDQKTIIAGLFKWWAKEALKLNEESYGISFNSSTAMVNEMGLFFYNSSSGNTLASVWNWQDSYDGSTTQLMLNVNMNYYSSLDADDSQGTSTKTSAFLDRTLAHEFTHAVMATNIHYFQILPAFIKEGFAELTHGIDDERSNRIFELAYTDSRLNSALNVSSSSASSADNYAGGYMFLRYLSKQAALQSIFHTLTANSSLITLSDADDIFRNSRDSVSISSAKGNDYISNNGSNVKFLYAAGDGNDTIKGFNATSTLNISGGDFSSITSGNNVIISVAGSTVTLLDAAKLSALNIIGTQTFGTWTISGTKATYTLSGRTTTISGLKNGVKESDLSISGSTIVLSANALGTSKITISGDYTLALADGLAAKTTNPTWNISSTSATLQQTTEAGYSVAADGKSVTYSNTPKVVTLATVSGLKSGVKDSDLGLNGTIITVNGDALSTSKVTLKGTGYKLALASNVATAPTSSYTWIASGTSAKYQLSETEYYTCDGSAINYVKPKETVVATVSGLKKDFSANDLSVSDKIITINSNALSNSKVTIKGTGYKLALGVDVATAPTSSYTWVASGTSAKYQLSETEYYTCDGSAINYVKPKETVIATISGLKKDFSANDLSVSDKIITINSNALSNSKVTIKGTGYKLALASNVATAPTSSYTWVASGTSAKYQLSETEYYTCDGSAINYVKPKETVVATISGLKKDFSANDLSVSDKIITINSNALSNSKVTIKGTGYKLALASNVATAPTSSYTWVASGTSAKYQLSETEYYTCDGSTINYVKPKETVVATVSGLKSGFKDSDLSVNNKIITINSNALSNSKVTIKGTGYKLALASKVATAPTSSYTWSPSGTSAKYQLSETEYYTCDGSAINYVKPKETVVATVSGLKSGFKDSDLSVNNKTITVNSNALSNSKVTIKGTGYKLALGVDVATAPTSSYTWVASGTSAKYQLSETEYYTCDGSTINYVKPKETVVATVSGLKSGFKDSDLSVNNKTITVNSNALSNSKVTLKGTGYKLALGVDVATAPTSSYTWIASGTSAKYQLSETEYYTCDGSAINYVKPNTTVVATVSGLKKDFSANDLSVNDKIITINSNALSNSKVTIKGTGYKLALASNVATAPTSSYTWVASGTSAKYQLSETEYYTCDGSTINYVKPKETVVATISGLKKDFSANDLSVSGKTITINGDALDTSKVTLKGTGYTLALGSKVKKTPKSSYTWITSSDSAKFQLTETAYYKCDGTSITYVKENTMILATVSGLKKDYSIDDIDISGTIITVKADALSTSKVTIKGNGYTLALGDDVAIDTKSSPNWILKSTTSTLKNVTPAHYTCNGTSITYVQEKELDTLATVNGVKKNLSASNYDAATNTVKLKNSDLNDKVTISGTKAFSFANDYSGSITGSAAADTITVAGNSVSINGGKGNDTIDLGNGSATFFYASGDGNDVIANFTSGKDKIVVTSGKASVAASGNNVVVTVGTGKITLTGAAKQTFDIVDKTNKVLATYTATGNNLLYSENYGTQPQIDALINESADYSVGEIETSNTMNLTQEKTQLTFGKK